MTNSNVDIFETVKQLENRFMAAMEQLAGLFSDKEQLEHLVEKCLFKLLAQFPESMVIRRCGKTECSYVKRKLTQKENYSIIFRPEGY